jgi:RHS repeat-associated protein
LNTVVCTTPPVSARNGLIENRWRTYVPTLGQYTSPDPEHRTSVMMPGPQAYAYANGNPLRFSDPSGLKPGDEFSTMIDTAIDAGGYAAALTVATGEQSSLYPSVTHRREYGGAICQCCGEEKYYATKFVRGGLGVFEVNTNSALGWCKKNGSDKAVATFHSHVSIPTAPSPGDLRNSRTMPRYIMGRDARFLALADGSVIYESANAAPVDALAAQFRAGTLLERDFVQQW